MKFWDSSALVPLVLDEPSTDAMKTLLRDDPRVVVSFITPLEVESAIWRRTRHPHEDFARVAALRRFNTLAAEWTVVEDIGQTLSLAREATMRHRLRAADAIQLGAALLVGRPGDLVFVAGDDELKLAASAEGFPTLP